MLFELNWLKYRCNVGFLFLVRADHRLVIGSNNFSAYVIYRNYIM